LLPDWDCEIFETHHRHKMDAPSGTAIMLGQRVAEGRSVDAVDPVADRSGKRVEGSIGYAVSRSGDVVGEHEVRWVGLGERIELVHRANNRDIFAHGALSAACWLSRQTPGRYAMADMLGLVWR
ncbi:MAG: dihydrodipicolinate reductase C-terminal domain-containing protein, partial [Dokdonella sp.]